MVQVVEDAPGATRHTRERATITDVRAYVRADGLWPTRPDPASPESASTPWQLRPVASPLSHYAGHEVRTVGGPSWVGHVIVEVESSDGHVGTGLSIGGAAACWLVEQHLREIIVGSSVDAIETTWDQMWRASLSFGRRGLSVHAISAVDLALWDLLGQISGRPVYDLLGGPARQRLDFYATTADVHTAVAVDFLGCKLPLAHGLAAGPDGMRRNVETFSEARDILGPDKMLAYDCWMSLDVESAVELAHRLRPFRPAWLEECLQPDDYLGHSRLRERFPREIAVAGGEHEATRWGYRTLTDIGRLDILQPDPTWCGGMTELMRIIDDAEVGGRRVVMHGSGPYSIHASFARISVPFAECIAFGGQGQEVTSMFGDLLLGDVLPVRGHLTAAEVSAPGFGVRINPDVELVRPARRARS